SESLKFKFEAYCPLNDTLSLNNYNKYVWSNDKDFLSSDNEYKAEIVKTSSQITSTYTINLKRYKKATICINSFSNSIDKILEEIYEFNQLCSITINRNRLISFINYKKKENLLENIVKAEQNLNYDDEIAYKHFNFLINYLD
ncbi:9581_t:CDS:1, partial [Dentiscutata erythropus]